MTANNAVNHGDGNFVAILSPYSMIPQVMAKAEGAVAFIGIFVINQFDGFSVLRLYNKVLYILVFLIRAAYLFQAITKRSAPSRIMPFLSQLAYTGFNTEGGLDALPGGLPIAYVVQ